MSNSRPFRVGIVGAGPAGHGLWERLLVLPHCEVVVYEPDDETADSSDRPLSHFTVNDWRRFLSDDAIETVLFLDGLSLDREQVQSVLNAGLNVGVLPPLTLETLRWPAFQAASETQMRVLNSYHDDLDFLAARAWLNANPLKPHTAIKRIAWVADLIDPGISSAGPDDGWFSNGIWEDLDQLLVLTGALPESIFAVEFSPERQSYSVILKFAAGVIAQLERRRDSLVPLDLGWTINQGYAPQRQYLCTDEGEIYDVPVENPSDVGIDPLAVFEDFGERDSWDHALDVLAVLSAISSSAESGCVTRLVD